MQYAPIFSRPVPDEYKQALEKWLNSNHRNYLKEQGEREWSNAFIGKHHSLVIIVS
jgi:hypothetical protein